MKSGSGVNAAPSNGVFWGDDIPEPDGAAYAPEFRYGEGQDTLEMGDGKEQDAPKTKYGEGQDAQELVKMFSPHTKKIARKAWKMEAFLKKYVGNGK